MQNTEDLSVNVEMYFNQIIELLDLLLNQDNEKAPTMLTLRQLAENGLNDFIKLNNLIYVEQDCKLI